jgi:hypothetical protein
MDSFYYQNSKNQIVSTVAKQNSLEFTPPKKSFFEEANDSYLNNDSTMLMSQPTLRKNLSHQYGNSTPKIREKSVNQAYEASIRTPIKKSKRRECTPIDSDEEKIYKRGNGIQTEPMDISSNMMNFQLLKTNNGFPISNNRLYFEKLSKSKFLQKIEENISSISCDNSSAENIDIFEKIKGAFLLVSLEVNDKQLLNKIFFKQIYEDSNLFNKITNLMCYSIFEGFNTKSDYFFKFLVSFRAIFLFSKNFKFKIIYIVRY